MTAEYISQALYLRRYLYLHAAKEGMHTDRASKLLLDTINKSSRGDDLFIHDV